MTTLDNLTQSHCALLKAAGSSVGFSDPIAFNPSGLEDTLLGLCATAKRVPINGLLVRSWCPDSRESNAGVGVGIAGYSLEAAGRTIKLASVRVQFSHTSPTEAQFFWACSAADYGLLYRLCLKADRPTGADRPAEPVLPAALRTAVHDNTIGFLEGDRLKRIKELGGRAKRGLIFAGPPGNGKTMACRWLWHQCRVLGYDWKIVTADDYDHARSRGRVEQLFTVRDKGIIFFDDMDVAMRDRDEPGASNAGQSVFLTALDGIRPHEGVVYVFTTNSDVRKIDKAFRRPGRIDAILEFKPPDLDLRNQFIASWHPSILAGIDARAAARAMPKFSYAEMDEVRELIIMSIGDDGAVRPGALDAALAKFKANRAEFTRIAAARGGLTEDE